MNTEQRARFEDAIKAIGYGALKLREDNGCYEYAPTEHAWTGFQAAEAPLLARIDELEAELKKTQIRAINLQEEVSGLFTKGELECAVALQSKKIIRLEKQLEERMRMIGEPKLYGDTIGCFKANREPFVVKMPELQPDGWVKLHEVIAAITAAGGRCV